jgi:hypothetical protein
MKLAKLLGMGHSFFGGNQEIAYRLNKFSLPKFNDGKNPFVPCPAEAPATPKVENKISAPAKKIAPVARAQKPALQPAAKPALAAWTAKLNPFRAPEPVASPPVSVQPELSLDAVKVVHNDLTDADVEIVPVKSHAAPMVAPVLPPARQAWEFLGESVLKS